jgi:hypothetical protein
MYNETQQRKLPVLKIHDSDFYVDMAKMEFRQVDNPKNVISFNSVQDNGDHTQVMYDPNTKNAFQGTWGDMSKREDLVLVRLPAAVDLDFGYLMSQLNKLSMEKFQERQAGKPKDLQVPTEKQLSKQSRGRGI